MQRSLIYGIYTEFENEGENNCGTYSFIIGVSFNNVDNIPEGLDVLEIPASSYQVFAAEKGKPETIGDKWKEIWQYDFKDRRTFLLEFERYKDDGEIDIFVGVK